MGSFEINQSDSLAFDTEMYDSSENLKSKECLTLLITKVVDIYLLSLLTKAKNAASVIRHEPFKQINGGSTFKLSLCSKATDGERSLIPGDLGLLHEDIEGQRLRSG